MDRDRLFQGAIDDLRIYNRALSEHEIRLLFLAPTRTSSEAAGTTNNHDKAISQPSTGNTP
jgi:hypothetical protein